MNFCPNCGFKLDTSAPEGGSPPQNALHEAIGSVLDEYQAQDGIKVAIPGVLDNRKRLMELRSRPIPIIKPVRNDGEMDKFGSLVVGDGLQQEG